jgi:hypothetical protein
MMKKVLIGLVAFMALGAMRARAAGMCRARGNAAGV